MASSWKIDSINKEIMKLREGMGQKSTALTEVNMLDLWNTIEKILDLQAQIMKAVDDANSTAQQAAVR